MTITEKARQYSAMFETDTRNDGKSFVKIKDAYTDNEPKDLMDSVDAAHGDRLPMDWVYGTYADLMQKVADYDLETVEELEDVRHEIVDGQVDIYTHELTAWLHEDICNVEYLEQAMEEYGTPDSGWRLLATAQYIAIDEVMSEVVDLLSK